VHPADVFCALAYTISVFPNDITGGHEKFSGLKEKYEKCNICRHIFFNYCHDKKLCQTTLRVDIKIRIKKEVLGIKSNAYIGR
jgi:hypothetical protein